MKKLSSYVFKYWYVYIFALFCMLTATTLDMIYPQITRSIIDDVITDGQLELLTRLLGGILLVGIGRCIFGYLKEFTFDRVGSAIGADMRKNLFAHIQSLSVGYFDNTNTGELMARLKDDIDLIQGTLGYVGMLIIEVVIHTVIVLYCMFSISPKLSIIPCIGMPIVATIAVIMERKLDKVYEEISEENAELNTVAEENLAGVRTVKAFAREKFEIQKFLSHNQRYYDLNMTQSRQLVRYQPMFQFITKLIPVLSVIFGGVLVIEGELTLGDLAAFTEYSRNIVWPMENIGWLANDFSAAVASRKKIKKIYDTAASVVEKEQPTVLPEVKGSVEFRHVSLKLGDSQVLSDISFHLEAGKTLGIMGATGAGKTSVINLLQRFYDADEGSILLDGTDIRDLSFQQLRGSISMVMQDVFLFSDTIKENIKMGKHEFVTDTIIANSAEFAQAKSFIEKMDAGYDTVIGERGVGLSGGQKQRISIARAVAKQNPILILDDSTSALDMETEHAIQQELSALTNTTKIIIAHRISAVRHADEILYLDGGKIAERGTHEELMALKGLYYQTFQCQYGAFLNAMPSASVPQTTPEPAPAI
ncbi:MAG: ABC transporter ATP-binding protein [Lachnospiraceae bacterium]|nr:ABC transporter ATP-binding protein [Lachnospiraceae bacterium]